MQKRSAKLLHQHFVCALCCCLPGRLTWMSVDPGLCRRTYVSGGVGVTLCYHLCTYLPCALFRLILTGPCQKPPKYLTKQKYSPRAHLHPRPLPTWLSHFFSPFLCFHFLPQVRSSSRAQMMCNQPLNMQCSITIWMWARVASSCRRTSTSSIRRMHSNYLAWVCVLFHALYHLPPTLEDLAPHSQNTAPHSPLRKKPEKPLHNTWLPLIMCIFYWKLVLLYCLHSALEAAI